MVSASPKKHVISTKTGFQLGSEKGGLTWESKVANVSSAAVCRFWSRSNEWEIRRLPTATRAMFIELPSHSIFESWGARERAKKEENSGRRRWRERNKKNQQQQQQQDKELEKGKQRREEQSSKELAVVRSFGLNCFWCRVTMDSTKDRAWFLSEYRLTC